LAQRPFAAVKQHTTTFATLLSTKVFNMEAKFTHIVGLYTTLVRTEIVRSWFGQVVDLRSSSSERKNDLKLHKRVTDLRKFTYITPPGIDPRFKTAPNVENLNLRVDIIGQKF
jgi:hypothetical protein